MTHPFRIESTVSSPTVLVVSLASFLTVCPRSHSQSTDAKTAPELSAQEQPSRPNIATKNTSPFRVHCEIGGEILQRSAQDALDEAWTDMAMLLGMTAEEAIHRANASLQIRILPPGDTWREAVKRVRSLNPHDSPEHLVGVTSFGERCAFVLVPRTDERYLEVVGLPFIVRETLVHEATHLLLDVAFDGQLPVWFHEGLAWALADRALHRNLSPRVCPLCARLLGVMPDGLAERRPPPLEWCMTPQPHGAWSHMNGVLLPAFEQLSSAIPR